MMGKIEQQHMDRLYQLIKEAEQRGDAAAAAALRWALYNLEYMFSQ